MVMLASTTTASARAEPASTAAATVYLSSRRASSCRTDIEARSFLWFLITQDHAAARQHNQQPRSARVAAPSAASPSADSRCASAGSPRSVHDPGSVICPLNPPEQTNTVAPD